MSPIQERLYAAISRVPELRRSVGGRETCAVYPTVKPQRDKHWPCAVYLSVGGGPVEALEGAMARPAYRVDVLAKGYAEGARIMRAVVHEVGPLLAEAPSWPTELYEEDAEVYRFSTTFVLAG